MNFNPKNEIEKKFYLLPKGCNCKKCLLIKEELTNQLGQNRFNEIARIFGH